MSIFNTIKNHPIATIIGVAGVVYAAKCVYDTYSYISNLSAVNGWLDNNKDVIKPVGEDYTVESVAGALHVKIINDYTNGIVDKSVYEILVASSVRNMHGDTVLINYTINGNPVTYAL